MSQFENLQKKISLNIDGLKDATSRARTVFIIINIACAIIFMALFNQQFSWLQHLNVNERPYDTCIKDAGVDMVDPSRAEMRKHYVDIYFSNEFFVVPILGIKVAVSDLTVYTALAMVIFITWTFFTSRRENHILTEIKHDFDLIANKIATPGGVVASGGGSPPDDVTIEDWKILLSNIYSGCFQNFVFITATFNDYYTKTGHGKNHIARSVKDVMMLLPVFLMLFILGTDINDYVTRPVMKQYLWSFARLDGFMLLSIIYVVIQIRIVLDTERDTKQKLSEMYAIVEGNSSGLYKYTI